MATTTPNISTAVSNIITAFHSLRSTIHKLKTNTTKRRKPKPSDASHRLDATLSVAPSTIHDEYARGLVAHGNAFQSGDNEALAALAATLVKLNTGLVNIISAFLNKSGKGRSSGGVSGQLDYASLALLSEAARIESCRSLVELRTRLSQRTGIGAASSPQQGARGKKNHGASKGRKTKAPPPKTSGQVHWAFVRTRPKGQRKASTSSTSSEGLKSTASTDSTQNSPATGVPKGGQSPRGAAATAQGRSKPKPKHTPVPVSPALSGSTAVASPSSASFPDKPITAKLPKAASPSIQSTIQSPPIPPKIPLTSPATPSLPPFESVSPPLGPPPRYSQLYQLSQPPQRFPSNRTATTASTRLGEIPMHRWPEPCDFDEMSRLNADAGTGTGANDGAAEFARLKERPASTPRRGLFAKVFRKTPVAGVVGA